MHEIPRSIERLSMQEQEAPGAERKIDRAQSYQRSLEPTEESIRQFEQEFGDRNGADHVIKDANSGDWRRRIGAKHQIDVAHELDGDVASFEEPIHPQSALRQNRVDIVTGDDYAVECKATSSEQIRPSTVAEAYLQAARRLEPNPEGRKFGGVVVVVPDGKMGDQSRRVARPLEAASPRIRFCEKHGIKQVLAKMKGQKRG